MSGCDDGVEDAKAKVRDLEAKHKEAKEELRRYGFQLGAAKRVLKKRLPAPKPHIQDQGATNPAVESVFSSSCSDADSLKRRLRVDKSIHFDRQKGMHSSYDHTKRMDLKVQITQIDYEVETVTDPLTGKSVRASTDEEGPRGLSYTWGTVGTLVKLNAGFAIPIHRIGMILSHKSFSPSKIFSILEWAANLLAPIYLHLPGQLADADILSGDDTPTKVLHLESAEQSPGGPQPLHQRVDDELRWQSPLASGGGSKKTLNVSLITGRTEPNPRSTIRFFRTHLGSFGNLLSRILELRSPKNKKLIIQTDLSTTNLPEKFLRDLFDIAYAGCGAHARRPIWRYKKEDEGFCYYLLVAFLKISLMEKIIDLEGRTIENIKKYRRYSNLYWQVIRNRCLAAMTGTRTTPGTDSKHEIIQWPPSHKLYEAAQYIVNNYEKLTFYLKEPRLPWTTNAEERGLRFEKCLLGAAKFKGNRNGRVILDILRTINATSTAAQVEIKDYLKWVYLNRDQIENNPGDFTPYAYALYLDQLRKTESPAPAPPERSPSIPLTAYSGTA